MLAPYVGGALLAGYILGFAIIFTIILALCIGLDSTSPTLLLFGGGLGLVLAVVFGLWDVWTIIFLGLLLAWLFINPMAGS